MRSLKGHRLQQVEQRLRAGSAYTDQGFIFADAAGAPLHPNTVRVQFRRLVAQASLPMLRIHDLRHTSATLMTKNKVNPKVVSVRLGHANVGITLGLYSHPDDDMDREAANGLEESIDESSPDLSTEEAS